jgi:hypothetical protein
MRTTADHELLHADGGSASKKIFRPSVDLPVKIPRFAARE